MTSKHPILFWFRQDLRLSDNPGLLHATQNGSVLPIYILDDETPGEFKMGGASRWWLHHSLQSLNHSLKNKLNIYQGSAEKILPSLIKKYNISAIYWNRCYEPWRIKQDTQLKALFKQQGIICETFNASLLWEPFTITKKDGKPYQVFTPFYQNGCLQAAPPRSPVPAPKNSVFLKDDGALTIDALLLLPRINWTQSIAALWKVGEVAAQKKLTLFLEQHLLDYKKNRDYPDKPHLSRLSPHLHFGEISPQQIWYSAQSQQQIRGMETDIAHFLREIAWREFSYYLLYYFPALPRKNFHAKFDKFSWRANKTLLKKWQQGQTGYPIIDAGMRELWQTGYMHNRVRMIVASFLVKNLQIHWHHGEDWFWDCLLDADLANNSASWQWVAGSGADAAPYFRIFNPVIQGEKFDPEGNYTRRFVPELQHLPQKYLFKPWDAPESVLIDSGVILGKTYPKPIVDLKSSREAALQAYRDIS